MDTSSYQEYDTSYRGLRSYLSKHRPKDERLQVRLKTIEPDYQLPESSTATTVLKGNIPSGHMSLTSLIAAQRPESGTDFDRDVEGITLTDIAGSAPVSERISFQDGSHDLDVLRVHDDTPVRITSGGQSRIFERVPGRNLFAIRGSLACEIPAVKGSFPCLDYRLL